MFSEPRTGEKQVNDGESASEIVNFVTPVK
jgi:hypothetical protein